MMRRKHNFAVFHQTQVCEMLAVILSGYPEESTIREEVWSKLSSEDAETVTSVMDKGRSKKKKRKKSKKQQISSTVAT